VLPIDKAESEADINDAASEMSSNYEKGEGEVNALLREGQFRQIA